MKPRDEAYAWGLFGCAVFFIYALISKHESFVYVAIGWLIMWFGIAFLCIVIDQTKNEIVKALKDEVNKEIRG